MYYLQISLQAVLDAMLHRLMAGKSSLAVGASRQMTIYRFSQCIREGVMRVINEFRVA